MLHLRISVPADLTSGVVAVLERAPAVSSLAVLDGASPRGQRIWVPAARPLEDVWVPGADLRDVHALPVLIVEVAAVDAVISELADAEILVEQDAPAQWPTGAGSRPGLDVEQDLGAAAPTAHVDDPDAVQQYSSRAVDRAPQPAQRTCRLCRSTDTV